MKLFLARTTVGSNDGEEGAWLQLRDPLVPQIRRGEIPQEMKELYMKDEIEDPADALSAILPSNFPKTGVVHVLVYLTLKRRRLENTQHFMEVPRINIKSAEYVTLPGELVAKCGLYPGGDLTLYCRPQVHELWGFLRDEVIAKDTRGWIVGPPGTGKSAAMLGFAASLDPEEWHVVWIRLRRNAASCWADFRSMEQKTFNFATFELPRGDGEKLFVCVDGFHEDFENTAFWARTGGSLRIDDRFVVSSSMESLRKTNDADADNFRIKHFFLYSWTQDEYVKALSDSAFYGKVADKLDAASDWEVNDNEANDDEWQLSEEDTKLRALQRKFYYGGGSCRFMFQYSTEKVKTILRRGFFSADWATFANYWAPNVHPNSVHALYRMQPGDLLWESFPVSSFVTSLFADASRDDTIDKLTRRVNRSKNPLVDGPLFEWLFLACVRRRAVKLFADQSRANVLPQACVLQFDPTKRFKKLSDGHISGNQSWLQPVVWEQGSFDAVHFDSNTGLVIFVQLTRSDTRDFRMRCFYQVLVQL